MVNEEMDDSKHITVNTESMFKSIETENNREVSNEDDVIVTSLEDDTMNESKYNRDMSAIHHLKMITIIYD
jgi:hypothetical protein